MSRRSRAEKQKKNRGGGIAIGVITVALVLGICVAAWERGSEQETGAPGGDSALIISEICSRNYQGYRDEQGAFPDYVELCNASSQVISLDGIRLSGNRPEIEDVDLTGKKLQPGEYLVVPLSLGSKKGGMVSLRKDGEILARVNYPALAYDTSYSLEQDGCYAVTAMTPAAPNGAPIPGKQKQVREPAFLKSSGFYDREELLAISAEAGKEIYYTLDGSTPGPQNGIRYSSPLRLGDLLERELLYANRTDVSVGFLTEKIEEIGLEAPGYSAPEETDECVVLRAAAVDREGNVSEPVTASYFTNEQLERYQDVTVVSLNADPEGLFGAEKGIYVYGDTFEEFQGEYLENNGSSASDTNWCWWLSNYHQTGREWERSAQMSYFTGDKRTAVEVPVGIRIGGASSRSYAQKSFRLFARKQLGGEQTFTQDFFGDGAALKTLCLSACGNDVNSHMKDFLAQTFLQEEPFSTLKMIPCVVFLNGEYWGFYYLTQSYDESYLESYYGQDPDNVVIFRNKRLNVGTEEDQPLWDQLIDFYQNTDFGVEENYEKLCQMVDMDEYIRYYAAQLYMQRRLDWPRSNYAIWRAREPVQNGAETETPDPNRWHYMLFDCNTRYGELDNPKADAFDTCMQRDFLFAQVVKSPEFRRKFREAFADMETNVFSIPKIDAWIDWFYGTYHEEILQSIDRYYGPNKGDAEFTEGVEQVRSFFHERPKYTQEELDNYVPLEETQED